MMSTSYAIYAEKGMCRRIVAAALACCFALAVALAVAPAGLAADSGGSVDMYRLYNPNSGEHFYTGNSVERDLLIVKGWKYEGIGWRAPAHSDTPVYRLYSPAGDHHYTMNGGERDMLVAAGWSYEGIGWYSSDDNRAYPLSRQYNSNASVGSHNYTLNTAERDLLVSQGWNDEGLAWYAVGPGEAAPVEPSPTEPSQPTTPQTSYKNCTAVWNALGRPINRNEPGYSTVLDRDGDGVGCEIDPR